MLSQNCEKRPLASSCLSVCPSAWNNSAPTERIFIKFYIWGHFENLSRKFTFHHNRTKITGTLHKIQYTFFIISRSFWTFIGPCIVIYFYSKTNQMHQCIKFILEWHSTCFGRSFRPSSGLQDCTYSNRHLSNKYCCLLASQQTAVSCLLLYVQSWTPDDGRKDRPKHVECHSKINLIHWCIWLVLLWKLVHFFLEWEMFQTKKVEEIKTHILCSVSFLFPKSWHFLENAEKYRRSGKVTDENTAHAQCMLDT